MSAPIWVERGSATGQPVVVPPPEASPAPPRWYARRPVQVVALAAAVALMATVDWPRPATHDQRAQDLLMLEKQVDGQQSSCSLGVLATIAGYDQIVTGQSSDRITAVRLAEQSALDCQPDGNPQLLELSMNSAPRDLTSYRLDDSIARIIDWGYPNGSVVCSDLATMLAHGSQPALLADARARLAVMSADAKAAQDGFTAAANALGVPPYMFTAMGQADPGSVVR